MTEVTRTINQLRVGETTYTANIGVRHSRDCKDRKRGSGWASCDCRKSLLLYDSATKIQRRESAHTRSWEKAQQAAKDWLDQFDPTKIEQKKQEAAAIRIEDAVGRYIADMITRLGYNGTVRHTESILGKVDPATKEVLRNGKLFGWLEKQKPRPRFIADITPAHLADFRNSWNFGSDLTTADAWATVKTFFTFCTGQGMIQDSPARNLKRPKIKRGNRTAIFTDKQCEDIVAAAKGNQRLETFVELLRWSGMAMIDAVQFRPDAVDESGVLRYERVKTGFLATVQLPDHLRALLRSVPLELGAVAGQPFLRKGIAINSQIQDWRRALQSLFATAGIKEVRTHIGTKPPHPHQFRDTFAVWNLRNGMSVFEVAKLVGHSNPTITAKSYLPWCPELEEAHLTNHRAALARIPKPSRGAKVVEIANSR